MKTTPYFVLGLACVAALAWAQDVNKNKTQPTPQPRDYTPPSRELRVSLSIDGRLESYVYPAGTVVHIVADKNKVLTDIQFFEPPVEDVQAATAEQN